MLYLLKHCPIEVGIEFARKGPEYLNAADGSAVAFTPPAIPPDENRTFEKFRSYQ
jgi:hypothetical protein